MLFSYPKPWCGWGRLCELGTWSFGTVCEGLQQPSSSRLFDSCGVGEHTENMQDRLGFIICWLEAGFRVR